MPQKRKASTKNNSVRRTRRRRSVFDMLPDDLVHIIGAHAVGLMDDPSALMSLDRRTHAIFSDPYFRSEIARRRIAAYDHKRFQPIPVDEDVFIRVTHQLLRVRHDELPFILDIEVEGRHEPHVLVIRSDKLRGWHNHGQASDGTIYAWYEPRLRIQEPYRRPYTLTATSPTGHVVVFPRVEMDSSAISEHGMVYVDRITQAVMLMAKDESLPQQLISADVGIGMLFSDSINRNVYGITNDKSTIYRVTNGVELMFQAAENRTIIQAEVSPTGRLWVMDRMLQPLNITLHSGLHAISFDNERNLMMRGTMCINGPDDIFLSVHMGVLLRVEATPHGLAVHEWYAIPGWSLSFVVDHNTRSLWAGWYDYHRFKNVHMRFRW